VNPFLRYGVIAVGLLNIGLGLAFLVRPELMAGLFYIEAIGSQGLATIRADFPGFFLTGGAFALLGALKNNPDWLKVPVMLLGTAFFGRTVSLAADGIGPTAFPPMIAEAVMIFILLTAMRSLGRAQ
jgi:hypothetical protein